MYCRDDNSVCELVLMMEDLQDENKLIRSGPSDDEINERAKLAQAAFVNIFFNAGWSILSCIHGINITRVVVVLVVHMWLAQQTAKFLFPTY